MRKLPFSRNIYIGFFIGSLASVLLGFFILDYNPLAAWLGIVMGILLSIIFLYALIHPKFTFARNSAKRRPFEEIYEDLGVFEYSDSGFTVVTPDGKLEFLWSNVTKMVAYKTDLYAVDQICLNVFLKEDYVLQLNEDTNGWYQFLKKSKENLKSIPVAWEIEIAAPAFERKETIIYQISDSNV